MKTKSTSSWKSFSLGTVKRRFYRATQNLGHSGGRKFNILARIREMLGEIEWELMIVATMLPRAF
ncbi:MAG: hypothetical protein V3R57_00335 [Candidatus Bathyarchaeia archaeon]